MSKIKFISFDPVKDIFKFFGSILLVALIFVKVSAFHVYEHHNSIDDDKPSCELCLFALDSQQAQVLIQTTAEIKVPNDFLANRSIIVAQDFKISKTSSGGNLFCRPPPSIL